MISARTLKSVILSASLLVLPLLANTAAAVKNISAISESDIRNSVIAFVNTTSSPGLEGATLNVENDLRNSDQWRSSLGFNAEVTLKNLVFNGYWGLGIVAGSLNDRIRLTADDGSPVLVNLTRDILSLRGSLGLSFPINEHFKIRPVLTYSISDLRTNTLVNGISSPIPDPNALSFYNTAQIGSTVGSIDGLYWYWFDDYKLDLSAHYNVIHTDAYSEDNPILNTYSWNQTTQVKGRFSGPTSLTMFSRTWRWQAYANYTKFLSINKTALGYTSLLEVGTGLEWELNIKPLDWFGWRYIGLNFGIITSTNVEGFNVGLSAR